MLNWIAIFWLLSFNEGQLEPIDFESLTHDLLETNQADEVICTPKLILHINFIYAKNNNLYKLEGYDD